MDLNKLVPPLELCQKIPAGEFAESAFAWFHNGWFGGWHIEQRHLARAYSDNGETYPAPTLQEILEELHKQQEDVFLKWSEHAYHEWLVNAYTHNKEDYQAHAGSLPTAAMIVWLKMKGIEA
jgi:hypothetical protein